MAPSMSLLFWIYSRQLRELAVTEEALKKEWQRILFACQRNLSRVLREDIAFRQALIPPPSLGLTAFSDAIISTPHRKLPKWKNSAQMIGRLVTENQTRDRMELLTSFDFERDELVFADNVVSNVSVCIFLQAVVQQKKKKNDKLRWTYLFFFLFFFSTGLLTLTLYILIIIFSNTLCMNRWVVTWDACSLV
jgi:hypothetical protein